MCAASFALRRSVVLLMTLVTDLLDRLRQFQYDRSPWDSMWIDAARYVLPDAERFDSMFTTIGPTGTVPGQAALDSVVSEPIGARRSREIYDTTSLWAVDRGAAGTLALVTPDGETWHGLRAKGPFSPKTVTDDEKRFYDDLRDYLFEIRNPGSGWGTAQKAALRCNWAFGTAVMFLDESNRGVESPVSYRYVPLSENFLGCNFEGVHDTNFRLFTRSARQCIERWGTGCSAKTQAMGDDPKRRDQLVTILHAVYPRNGDKGSYGNSNRDNAFASCTVEVGEKKLIGESGFFEFPYRIDNWQRNNGASPYSEGPIALALAEIKSLNMLAKQELLGVQQWVNPPLATFDDGQPRLDLNPRAINPGYIDSQGRLLAQPIITTQRPDFANLILEQRRAKIGNVTYLDLWQTILDSTRQQTAYEVMVKASEKGDMLGPVGTSLQIGLEHQVDREIAIIGRRGAFRPGSPLAAPQSLAGKDIGPRFTSPLDRMREMGKLQGMTQLLSIGAQLEQIKPGTMDKIDADKAMDEAQRILGAPREIMTSDADLAAIRGARKQQQDAASGIALAHGAGNAAQAGAAGVRALADSPAAADILRRLSGVGAGQQAAA